MRIEIEIPKEFEGDYDADKFRDFFSRAMIDIETMQGMCDRYEIETAEMFIKAFAESKPAYDVEEKVAELEKESFSDDCGRAILLSDAERIVRGKDKCSTCQYSSGHVSTCMLKSSVCYHKRRIVRGKE